MKLLIDISEYNVEYIRNAYRVPQDINMVIAEAIINGKQIPTPHGRLKDVDRIEYENVYFEDVGESYEIVGKDDIDELPTVIEAEDGT